MASPSVRRAPKVVWRAHRGTVLVGVDGQVHQLAGAAALAWLILEEPATVEAIVAADPERWAGAGDDPLAAAAEALDALVVDGLVELVADDVVGVAPT